MFESRIGGWGSNKAKPAPAGIPTRESCRRRKQGNPADAKDAERDRYAQQDLPHAFILRKLVDAAKEQRVGANDGRQHELVAFLVGVLSSRKLVLRLSL